MPENIDDLIAHLRELDKKASPAPWEFTGTKFTPPDYIEPGDLLDSEGYVLMPEIERFCSLECVSLIVEARNALPALLDHIDRLEAKTKKAELAFGRGMSEATLQFAKNVRQAKAEAWDEAIEQAFLYNLSPEGWERRQEIKNPYKEQAR